MTLPVALPSVDGTSASLHDLVTPIVEGTGEELPGLLGLRTLEQNRAILDVGSRQLIFPGPGKVEYKLPPGSITIPLEKAPSGHLCMVVDAYKAVPKQHGGLSEPDSSMALHAAASVLETPGTSSASGAFLPADHPRNMLGVAQVFPGGAAAPRALSPTEPFVPSSPTSPAPLPMRRFFDI